MDAGALFTVIVCRAGPAERRGPGAEGPVGGRSRLGAGGRARRAGPAPRPSAQPVGEEERRMRRNRRPRSREVSVLRGPVSRGPGWGRLRKHLRRPQGETGTFSAGPDPLGPAGLGALRVRAAGHSPPPRGGLASSNAARSDPCVVLLRRLRAETGQSRGSLGRGQAQLQGRAGEMSGLV